MGILRVDNSAKTQLRVQNKPRLLRGVTRKNKIKTQPWLLIGKTCVYLQSQQRQSTKTNNMSAATLTLNNLLHTFNDNQKESLHAALEYTQEWGSDEAKEEIKLWFAAIQDSHGEINKVEAKACACECNQK